MLPTLSHLDKQRVPHPSNGHMGGPDFGAFAILRPKAPVIGTKHHFFVIASSGCDELPWDHVSASGRYYDQTGKRCFFTPSWADMCWLKDLFFRPEECVMQLHVPAADHINVHEHTLHLWRPHNVEIPRPPQIAV